MSYLLDQEVSRDSINVNFQDISVTVLKEIESEMYGSSKSITLAETSSKKGLLSRKASRVEATPTSLKKTLTPAPSQANSKSIGVINQTPTVVVKKSKVIQEGTSK